MTTPSTIYGTYSLGSGAVLSDPSKLRASIGDADVISDYQRSISIDLRKSGISQVQLSNWHVMDCGTGRQAIALLKLGAKKVSHFDLSPENVVRMNQYIKENKLEGRLTSTCCDIGSTNFSKYDFDLVYLNGIVQHFSHVGQGILNCLEGLNDKGFLWLYFYRAGTFHQFFVFLLRNLVHGSNHATNQEVANYYWKQAGEQFQANKERDFNISSFMDSLFTRYAHLYYLRQCVDFVAACNLAIVSSSGADPWGRDVDHDFARAAAVVTLQRKGSVLDQQKALKIFSPEEAIDELNPPASPSPEITETIKLYREVKARLASPSNQRTIGAVVELYQKIILSDVGSRLDKHTIVQQTFREIISGAS